MKTLKALVACLFAGLVVMGFVGCGQPEPGTYVYEGNTTTISGVPAVVTITVDDNGTWVYAAEAAGEKHDIMKGTYEGTLTNDGEIKLKGTHRMDENFNLKPVEPFDVANVFMADKGKKMILKYYYENGDDLVLTRK